MLPATARGMSPAEAPQPMPGDRDPGPCGGAVILDLALCLILAVTVVGLLMLAR